MKNKEEIIKLCLKFKNVYEDYPFDEKWACMRHCDNKKTFAFIFEREGKVWINLKCEPALSYIYRTEYSAVIPAYHMNKEHWNSVILDGTVEDNAVKEMIYNSYNLTKKR